MPFCYLHVNDEPESTCFHAVDLAAAKCEATKMAGKKSVTTPVRSGTRRNGQ
jgi:hypothetical protein